MNIHALRRELRRDAIARRLALDPGEHARRSRAIRRHLAAHFPQLAALRVGFFWPMNGEPDLRPLLEAWLAGGGGSFAALLPVVVDAAAALAFRAWRPDKAMA
jgi:5-formyltetrahydrofolate cyclo-ligase